MTEGGGAGGGARGSREGAGPGLCSEAEPRRLDEEGETQGTQVELQGRVCGPRGWTKGVCAEGRAGVGAISEFRLRRL